MNWNKTICFFIIFRHSVFWKRRPESFYVNAGAFQNGIVMNVNVWNLKPSGLCRRPDNQVLRPKECLGQEMRFLRADP